MKKRVKSPRVKVNPDVIAKKMKKQLGEFHSLRVVKGLVDATKDANPSDFNVKDIFDFNEVKRNRSLWEQVYGILNK